MFEPDDLELMRPVGARDNRWGMVCSRRQGGALTVGRVAWNAYRWTMIQFAKFVLVEFGYAPKTEEVEEVVDAWLESRPLPQPVKPNIF